jgi:polysaccharide biosynthesis/export protein
MIIPSGVSAMVRHRQKQLFLTAVVSLTACTHPRPNPQPDAGPVPPVIGAADGHVAIGMHPLSPARLIVPRDLIEVTVFEAPALSRAMRVSDDGMITLPLLGPLQAARRTPRELEIAIQDTLRRTYMRDPRVVVEVKEEATQPIYVVGEVNQPGALLASGSDPLTVLRALAVARGPKPSAAQGRAMVLRPRPQTDPLQIRVNLNDIARGKADDVVLLPNDVLYVPKNSERAVALGVIDALVRVVTFRTIPF